MTNHTPSSKRDKPMTDTTVENKMMPNFYDKGMSLINEMSSALYKILNGTPIDDIQTEILTKEQLEIILNNPPHISKMDNVVDPRYPLYINGAISFQHKNLDDLDNINIKTIIGYSFSIKNVAKIARIQSILKECDQGEKVITRVFFHRLNNDAYVDIDDPYLVSVLKVNSYLVIEMDKSHYTIEERFFKQFFIPINNPEELSDFIFDKVSNKSSLKDLLILGTVS